MHIAIESSLKLTKEQASALETKLHKLFPEQDLDLSYSVDKNLLGGIRIITPDKTMDLTLAARLNQLRTVLQTNV